MTTDGTQPLAADQLPKDLNACHALIRMLHEVQRQLDEQLGNANRKLTQMEHQLQQLLRRLYGRSSEKIDPRQMALFAEMLKQLEAQSPPIEPEPIPEPAAEAPKRKGHGRRRIPDDVPRERIVHDLPEEDKPCPCCGEIRSVIGEEVTEQIDFVPAQIKAIQHVQLKYACKTCEQNASESGPQIVTACKPLAPIEKGLAAPGLLAYVAVSKYGDHLPLNRLERMLQRCGIDIARSTMCDWMRQTAEALRPLYDVMLADVLASKVIHTDDTPVDVQDPKLGKTREGRFWVYLGDPAHPQVLFDYTPNRKRDGPMTFLKDWGCDVRRYLQADAFGGYDGIYAGQAGGNVTEVACWAHARRKFHEARNADHARSAQALAYIHLLYDVERQAKEQFEAQGEQPARSLADIRLELRQKLSVPRLAEMRAWMDSLPPSAGGTMLPKSPLGQAVTYALNQWDALCVYTTDGELAIDNNAAENALRRVAIGRKNWLFAGSDNGGRTAAVLFSVIATCQRHGVEPFAYLRDVLTRIAAHPASRVAELLPDRCQPSA